MSLKVEQILDNFFFTEGSPKIYATGVYIEPAKIKIGNKERFVWVVSQFDGDSYLNGKLCSPEVMSKNLKDLCNINNQKEG